MNKRDYIIADDLTEPLQEILSKEIVDKVDTGNVEILHGTIYDSRDEKILDRWKAIYDKPQMKNDDCLTVGIDIDPRGIVKSILAVMRKTDNGEIRIVNVIDENVEDIYKILLGIEKFKRG